MRFNTQAEMMAANETGLYLPQDTGNLTPGVACMANTSRFIEAHFSEPLTTYATGWRDPEGLQDLLDFVAPPVEVPRRFEYVVFVTKKRSCLRPMTCERLAQTSNGWNIHKAKPRATP
jgi:hypothetical protein